MATIPVNTIKKLNESIDGQINKFRKCIDYICGFELVNRYQKKFADTVLTLLVKLVRKIEKSNEYIRYQAGKISTTKTDFVDSWYAISDTAILCQIDAVYVPLVILFAEQAINVFEKLGSDDNVPRYIVSKDAHNKDYLVATCRSLFSHVSHLREISLQRWNSVENLMIMFNDVLEDYETYNEIFVAKFVATQANKDKHAIEKQWKSLYGTNLYTQSQVDLKNIRLTEGMAGTNWFSLKNLYKNKF